MVSKKELRSLVLLGAGVIAWSIWLHRNNIVFKNKKIFSFAGYLCSYPSTLFLGYSPTVGYAGYRCSGLAAGGKGLLFLGVWVAV
jgi:hypothetical protein